MDMGVGVPLSMMPSTVQVRVSTMVDVGRVMTTMVMVVIVISPTTVCLRRKR